MELEQFGAEERERAASPPEVRGAAAPATQSGEVASAASPRLRTHEQLGALPGYEWIRDGVADLRGGRVTVASLLVSMAADRLRLVGLDVPPALEQPERRLYDLLHAEDQDSAHGRYNALARRLVSFCQAAECAR